MMEVEIVRVDPIATILFVDEVINPEMGLISEDDLKYSSHHLLNSLEQFPKVVRK